MAWWSDVYKLWHYALSTQDPLSSRETKRPTGAGVLQPDAITDIRQDGSFWGGQGRGVIRLHDTNDFVDLSTITNRASRYKEYDRLLNVAEIESALNVFADETCVAGGTIISTLLYGPVTIEWLVENVKEEFLVYCWDFKKQDLSLGWAYNPRMTKVADTVRIALSDGSKLICTPDHRILTLNGDWKHAGELDYGDELMPFYRLPANYNLTNLKFNQFPRVFTKDGWKHERQFIDEWKLNQPDANFEMVNQLVRLIAGGMMMKDVCKYVKKDFKTVENKLHKAGFTVPEIKWLAKKPQVKKVVGITKFDNMPVYDLSVRDHENFCTDSCIVHNCQTNDEGNMLKISVKNKKVKEELEFLLFHRKMLNVNRRLWNWAKKLFTYGDLFLELVIDSESPKAGILKTQMLPVESMFRIETTKGRLVEFQQSQEGPDYESLSKSDVTKATEQELKQSTALRFDPNSIVHMRIGEDRKLFYPYGISLVEAARGPAHQLRLMEDAMIVYRLSRAPERRVFYIDVGQLPPFKAEAFMERMKDQFRKKKVANKTGLAGASSVEEKWHAPAQDEDYWIPIRANAQTRVETLPGAQNLGEVDDAIYFRNKLFTSMNFPRNYFGNEDPQATRITLSAQDVKFARQIERLQAYIEDGLWEICDRHLKLRGVPDKLYDDLTIKLSPPSEWREMSRAEIITNRINNATGLKGAEMFSTYDIYIDHFKLSTEEAQEKLSRLKIQQLENLKLQVLAANPVLLGVGMPGQGDQEIGAQPGGPNPMLGPEGGGTPGGEAPPGGPPGPGGPQAGPPPGGESFASDEGPPPAPAPNAANIADPSAEDLKKYDLEIQNYSADKDLEEPDYSELR